MSENAKTITFVVVGMCAVLLGLASRPSTADVDSEPLAGTNLTSGFSDADAAKRLRVVRFDEDTATLREFEVAEQGGMWSIPSKDGYPADAAKQMAEAATSLMDRKIMDVASKNAADHEAYGVIDPLSPKLEPGQKGVGTRVTMSGADNKPLADLIVGKSVRGAEGQRYVREAGRELVYIIEIDPSKLSTSFEDWIEKDLLKLNGWDLQQVEVKDYSAELVQGIRGGQLVVGIDPHFRADMTFAYNDAEGKWKPVKLQRYESTNPKDGKYVDFTLAKDEELNEETLNALKTALDDLKIVDVVHKPAGLSKDLKAGTDFTGSDEARISLMRKGFTTTQSQEGGEPEILSGDGEVIATMKNGTEYVLRFGSLTSVDEGGEKKDEAGDAKAAADATAKKDGKSDVHRYLFVMARFNKDAVNKPELVELPALPAGAEEKAKKDEKPAENSEAAAKDEKKDETKGDAAKEKSADEAKADEKAEKKDADAKTDEADAKKDEAAEKKEGESKLDKVIAERKRLEAENQRKLDEYNALIKKGEEAVKDLNARFGDWYFVVDDEVFKKVRVGADKVIKKQEKKDAAANPGGAAPPSSPLGLPAIPGAGKK